ncbi:hypothetical protein [Frigoriglobus tundricola]|uniref:Phage protein n=1 Tax=Frigoriglobus tundricola TaxID=2774151 RepID=A0A6M5YY52_9BACT|nr:hypothetical protein [Frigoriglobus tundricola]QJW98410.1 Phage protein [Frigoriglobus tundricola]
MDKRQRSGTTRLLPGRNVRDRLSPQVLTFSACCGFTRIARFPGFGPVFTPFRDVHKWANFLKHPKAFLLVHHPVYFYTGMPEFGRSKHSLVIDQAFVGEYYSGSDKNAKLHGQLKNKRDVAVLSGQTHDATPAKTMGWDIRVVAFELFFWGQTL